MRTPACPVAPATNTVEESLRLVFPNDKPGEVGLLLTTGIKEVTSGIFPNLKPKGLLELAEPSSEEESSFGFPKRIGGKGPDFFARTLNFGFLWLRLE